eukprot:5187626-Amphidinium_carterae.1
MGQAGTNCSSGDNTYDLAMHMGGAVPNAMPRENINRLLTIQVFLQLIACSQNESRIDSISYRVNHFVK